MATEVTLVDILSAIDKLFTSLNSIEKITNDISLGSSDSDVVQAITVGCSNINSTLVETNLHLGNIEAISRLILQFIICVVIFKGLYFVLGKVFFNC